MVATAVPVVIVPVAASWQSAVLESALCEFWGYNVSRVACIRVVLGGQIVSDKPSALLFRGVKR